MELLRTLATRLAVVSNAETERIIATWYAAPDRMPARAFLSVHQAVAAEALRQMRWAWMTGCLQGTDQTMSCGYSRERLLEDYNIRLDYPHIAERDGFEARFEADVHLAPDDWKP